MSATYIPDWLREEVKRRANFSCEYCLVPAATSLLPHHMDHIIPEKQGGPTLSENLAYACQQCNIRKGDSVVAFSYEWRRATPLFDPRNQEWNDHFLLSSTGLIEPKTRVGEATVRLLQINRLDRIARRQLLLDLELL